MLEAFQNFEPRVIEKVHRIELNEVSWESDMTSAKIVVAFDGTEIAGYTFWRDQAGKAQVNPPMAHIYLGSRPAVEIRNEVEAVLSDMADQLLPQLKPLGLNRKTGEEITICDPRRLDLEDARTAMRRSKTVKFVWTADSGMQFVRRVTSFRVT